MDNIVLDLFTDGQHLHRKQDMRVLARARLAGDSVYLPSTSMSGQFIVNNTWLNIIITFVTQYLLFIVAAAGAS